MRLGITIQVLDFESSIDYVMIQVIFVEYAYQKYLLIQTKNYSIDENFHTVFSP